MATGSELISNLEKILPGPIGIGIVEIFKKKRILVSLVNKGSDLRIGLCDCGWGASHESRLPFGLAPSR